MVNKQEAATGSDEAAGVKVSFSMQTFRQDEVRHKVYKLGYSSKNLKLGPTYQLTGAGARDAYKYI